MKLLSYILIVCLLLSCHSFVFAQSQYEAKAIFKKGNSTYQTPVFILLNSEALQIVNQKNKNIQKSFPYSIIDKSEYSYTEKPQIAQGVGVATFYALMGAPILTFSTLGVLFAFSKKKKHWLVLSIEREAFLFELKKENYRQLLFEMNSKGIRIEDSGDRNYKPPEAKKAET
jgi:hypothetical protein